MNRFRMCAILTAGFGLLLAGCGSNTDVGTMQITPASQSIVAGQTAQFIATGTIGHGKHPPTNQDVTTMVTWTSSAPGVATINSSGLATAVSAGTATITGSMSGVQGRQFNQGSAPIGSANGNKRARDRFGTRQLHRRGRRIALREFDAGGQANAAHHRCQQITSFRIDDRPPLPPQHRVAARRAVRMIAA